MPDIFRVWRYAASKREYIGCIRSISMTLSYTFHRHRRHKHVRAGRDTAQRGLQGKRLRHKRDQPTEHLRELGARVSIGQVAANIEDPDVVVYTAAIRPDNEELREAERRGIPMLTRAELLGELMNNYGGSHKHSRYPRQETTTTSMITEILMRAGKDPTVTVGGILDSIGGNIRVGSSDYFAAEACEYTNSFLSFWPTIEVILNVEADHLDFFKDLDDIRHSFKEFINRLPCSERGFLVINSDIKDLDYFLKGLGCDYATFGSSPDADLSAKDISFDELARPSYTLLVDREELGRVELGDRHPQRLQFPGGSCGGQEAWHTSL